MKQKLSNLKHRSNFSRFQLGVFVIVFALLGGYLLYRSFATGPLVATLEAEQMSLPTGGSVITDSLASAGKAVVLASNGTTTGSVSFPSSVTSLVVNARGAQCQGAPLMNVAIDGTNLINGTAVSSTVWASYSATPASAITAGTHSLSISFTNDYSYAKNRGNSGKTTNCSRDLYLDVSSFYGPVPPPTSAPTVTLSASPTSVTAGSASILTWNSTNADSCTASGSWSGAPSLSGSTSTGAVNQNSVYTLTCTGAGGSASASATVSVTAAGFSTSLTAGMTITPPYTWTFNPGVTTTAGYFWADGNLLQKITGPGPYTFTINSATLASGVHQLGHAWDLTDGTHQAPPSAYSVTIAGATGGGTPPPSGGGSLTYSGNFEVGDISQWNWGGQCANTGDGSDTTYNRGTVTVSSAYAGEGSYGARFVIPPDGSRRQACEVLDHRPLVVDTYYSLMFKLDPGNTTNAWGATLAQLNYQGIWGPPEGLFARSSTTDSESAPNSVGMIIQSGFCYAVNTPSPGCANYSSYYGSTTGGLQYAIPPGKLVFGQWHELVCHIHFATDSSGVYECWYRMKGQTTWTLGGRYSGVPTVQWENSPSLPSEDVDKIGAYRPQDTTSQWIADEDGFYKGTSFDAVASKLP